ncbi:hypothetical protein EVAR_20886_1 [Eumeta japonica]|uniref:Uncharacterized protein n=1 Tax=Eumeta variegata TaxID=151549 RepID=A0A4C1UXE5_EUMVA|nr:hypothetical protein EVAR_20886_1 [Eumeta japonica]
MSNPAYSLDLAPCDFFCLQKLRNQQFSSPEEVVEEYEKHVSEVNVGCRGVCSGGAAAPAGGGRGLKATPPNLTICTRIAHR